MYELEITGFGAWLTKMRTMLVSAFVKTDDATLEVDNVVALTTADCGASIVRVPNRMIDRSKEDPTRFHRNESVVVVNPRNGHRAVLRVMGTGKGIEGMTATSIAVDYDAKDVLGISRGEVQLVVRRARGLDIARHHWSHENPVVKHSYRLGVVGAVGVFYSVAQDIVGLVAKLFA